MKAPEPKPTPEAPSCGNCCNAVKSTRSVGRIICTSHPPQVVARPGGMGANVYPELPADKLGCSTFWNVNAQLFHILGQAVTLASQPASNDNGQGSTEKVHSRDPATPPG